MQERDRRRRWFGTAEFEWKHNEIHDEKRQRPAIYSVHLCRIVCRVYQYINSYYGVSFYLKVGALEFALIVDIVYWICQKQGVKRGGQFLQFQ